MFNTCLTNSADAALSLERRHQENQEKISKLKFLETMESNKLYKNQKRLEQTDNALKNSKVQYTSAQVRLGILEQEHRMSTARFTSLEAQTGSRIRTIYKKQTLGLLNALLASTDINTFSDVIYYQNIIMKRDKENLAEARRVSERLASIKHQIEVERQVLAQSINDINQQQRNIQRAIEDNSNMIERLRTDRAYYERSEKELARQSNSLGEMINKSSYSDEDIRIISGFMKPVPGPITSPFGWRIHPIFKSRTFHSGIDIAGAPGAQIRASNSGRVIFANWYGGYGKVVVIDHGVINGSKITTLYAHLSAFTTDVGAMVAKGQVIGIQGSTGYSTGPHCHFEVRKNGKPMNPLNYI